MKTTCHRCGEICCRCWRTNLACFLILIATIVSGCVTVGHIEPPTRTIAPIEPPLPTGLSGPVQRMAAASTDAQKLVVSASTAPPQRFIIWDFKHPDLAGFVVYEGPARGEWALKTAITNNFFPYVNGTHYGVAALSFLGEETPLTYFPSNRIEEVWLQAAGSDMKFKDLLLLKGEHTNTIDSQDMQLLRIDKRLLRYE
jgi:hypothetical protein